MTKVELALILKIIDAHTVRRTYNYGAPDKFEIDNIDALKDDIERHYEQYMKEDNE